jgi:hypothetical protein
MQNFKLTTSKVNDFKNDLMKYNGSDYMELVRDLIKSDPFEGNKFYIFSIIKLKDRSRFHQPRLTKPEPVPGGTLLHVDPKDPDYMKICWTLPSQESFELYRYGKVFGDQFVWECIQTYKKNPKQLMCSESGDVSEEKARDLYVSLKKRVNEAKAKEKEQATLRKQASSFSMAEDLS